MKVNINCTCGTKSTVLLTRWCLQLQHVWCSQCNNKLWLIFPTNLKKEEQ